MTTTVPAPQVTLIRAVFDAIDSMRAESAAQLLHDDITFVFGNAPAVHGRPTLSRPWSTSRRVGRHQARTDRAVAGLRRSGHRHRRDDRALHPPGRLAASPAVLQCVPGACGLVADYRIYMDVNPVFAAAA